MQSTIQQKLLSLMFTVAGVILALLLFDRGWLALLGPIIFVLGILSSFLIIKRGYGWRVAIIPMILWLLAIIINHVSGSYEYYSEYDFIDPMNGFVLSVLFALIAFCVTARYFFKRNAGPSKS